MDFFLNIYCSWHLTFGFARTCVERWLEQKIIFFLRKSRVEKNQWRLLNKIDVRKIFKSKGQFNCFEWNWICQVKNSIQYQRNARKSIPKSGIFFCIAFELHSSFASLHKLLVGFECSSALKFIRIMYILKRKFPLGAISHEILFIVYLQVELIRCLLLKYGTRFHSHRFKWMNEWMQK